MFACIAILALAAISAIAAPLQPRVTHSGTATYFWQNGIAGACGKVHKDTDWVVALHTDMYANGSQCGRTITLTDNKTGKQATALVADECPTCDDSGSIDLSHSLFTYFAPESAGVFPVSWHFNPRS